MRALPSPLRKQLETAVLSARRAAEGASRAAIDGLGVFQRDRPAHLDAHRAGLRNELRAKWRQLGGGEAAQSLLIAECAYEQWHRLLFARFLAENGLLLHPRYKAPVTLTDCTDLAAELGEPDGWSVAARFAAEILPGIFRLDDPCVRLRLAPEGRHALEQILEGLPAELFAADDALGWVYQFWQKDKKDEINDSERKIGGADLGPVTQLFTENYMVRFLLENSLGAWWAARHPDSPLVKGFEYLRLYDDGKPAAGSFGGWPERVAEVTVMDPCCGSGHFLVEAFSMLWQMRAEEEGLSPVEAQDGVLRDNLFGLELDPRCVQIAMFGVALQAWKAGGGWRQLPVPNIACSGIPVKARVEEWKALAGGDQRLENALVRLHILFRDADTFGSLIDPKRTTEFSDPTGLQTSFDDVEWHTIFPVLATLATSESLNPASSVLGADVAGLAQAAEYLSRHHVLVTTNVPYLSAGRQDARLRAYAEGYLPDASADLATAFFERFCRNSVTQALVTPQSWQQQQIFEPFRRRLLRTCTFQILARIGNNAWQRPGGGNPFKLHTTLSVSTAETPPVEHEFTSIDIGSLSVSQKAAMLQDVPVGRVRQLHQLENPEGRIVFRAASDLPLLLEHANSYQGIATADYGRYGRSYWEQPENPRTWSRQQSTVIVTTPYGGREHVVMWEEGRGSLASSPAARVQGLAAWDRRGVAVTQMGDLKATLYTGEIFDNNVAAIIPNRPADLAALWSFCSSPDFNELVRSVNSRPGVTNRDLLKVPFDIDRWRQVAEQAGPLPEPWSNEPTQWLFGGRPEVSTAPLQVAVALLSGYRWPEQAESDDVEPFTDTDGIVCLPSVAGEAPAADRVQQLLAAAFGGTWSFMRVRELLEQAGSKKTNLADWLRDEFFKQHCALFGNRPFVWHIWDGQRDGFSALVNYHRLDRKLLEKLTYGYLGQDWVERLRDGVRDEVAGDEARLSAALNLQRRLEAILDGEKPYDIYVRWKERHEQPIGWEPDLNDGVRLNIRPFVEAGVLRAPFNIHWRKDRGKNPDGTERHNDIHLTLAEKTDARKRAGRA